MNISSFKPASASQKSVKMNDFNQTQKLKAQSISEYENGQVLAGNRALLKAIELQNNGAMKRILNGYVNNNTRSLNKVSYNKKTFMPFVDERDHLGNLIDS